MSRLVEPRKNPIQERWYHNFWIFLLLLIAIALVGALLPW
jgi:hypothetical protein